MGIETKFYDTGLNTTLLTAPADCTGGEVDPTTLNTISAPAQGDNEDQRIGKRITIKSAQVVGRINVAAQVNQTAVDAASLVYVALVQDKQSNGAQLSSEDVFINPSGVSVTAAAPLRNLQFSKRFRVLKVWHGTLEVPVISYDGTNMEQGGATLPFRLDWKGEMIVEYSTKAGGAGVATVSDNSIHVVAFCSSVALAPSIAYNARIRFLG